MILILSQSKNEPSTEDVIQWLNYYNGTVKRINGDNFIFNKVLFKIESSENVCCDLLNIDFDKVNIVWFRRYKSEEFAHNFTEIDNSNYFKLKLQISIEFKKFYFYFTNVILKNATHISSLFKENNINKLEVLKTAVEIGLNVPDTIITNSKLELKYFVNKHDSCIVKPMGECEIFFDNDFFYKMLTEKISNQNLNIVPNNFLVSMFQENIPKSYELRVFYFFGDFYSMAIFSQDDDQTKIDFRNYNSDKPNRTVPYKLSSDIEDKLSVLMKKLNLDTGSIDLIKSKNDKYYFLEVNPNGQFAMTSQPCNYYIDEKIAIKLKQLDDEKSREKTNSN